MSLLWDGVREGCGSCEYGRSRDAKQWVRGVLEDVVVVDCWRYPPVFIMQKPPGGLHAEPVQTRPLMTIDDWCGEWKRKQQYEA